MNTNDNIKEVYNNKGVKYTIIFSIGKVFRHDPRTGIREVGFTGSDGYFYFYFNGKNIKRGRFIYNYYHNHTFTKGEECDHISRDKTDDTISNLRCVDASTNMKNRKIQPCNSTGFKNVCHDKKRKLYRVHFTHKKKLVYHKFHKTLEAAIEDSNYQRQRLNKEFNLDFRA
jgi:hypothetical protein